MKIFFTNVVVSAHHAGVNKSTDLYDVNLSLFNG